MFDREMVWWNQKVLWCTILVLHGVHVISILAHYHWDILTKIISAIVKIAWEMCLLNRMVMCSSKVIFVGHDLCRFFLTTGKISPKEISEKINEKFSKKYLWNFFEKKCQKNSRETFLQSYLETYFSWFVKHPSVVCFKELHAIY